MKEDLRWLGLDWDAETKQSERLPLYRAALAQLIAAGLAYPCDCSRRDLQQATQAPHEEDDEPIYNNRCRPVSMSLSSFAEGGGPASPAVAPSHMSANYRFRIPSTGPITFPDLHAGPQSFTPGKEFGDFLIWRKALSHDPQDAGLPSYQLACVVDDADMRITEVVRGRDLLKSTARQILLQRALHLPTPTWFHCDLLRDASGIRLAKRHDALSLRALRSSGLSPAEVRAMLETTPTSNLKPEA